jgi:hypothetical protein
MAIIPKNSFAGAVQVKSPSPVFRTSRANADQFGAQEARALSRAGQLRSQVGTKEAEVGAQIGQSIADFGKQMVELAKKEKKEDDTNAAKRGLIELKQGITATTIGDSENPGLFSLRGEAALTRIKGSVQDIDKLALKIAEDLPSDEARTMFQISSALSLNSSMQEIGKFRINQRRKVDEDTAEATLLSAKSAAAGAPGAPDNIRDQHIIVAAESNTISGLRGHSKETAAAFATQQHSELMEEAVISALKQGRGDVAKDILEGTNGYKLPKGVSIDGSVKAKLIKMVNTSDALGKSQELRDDILSSEQNPVKQLQMARSAKVSPEVRKNTVALIKQSQAEQDTLSRRQTNLAVFNAYKHIRDGGQLDEYIVNNPEAGSLILGSKNFAALQAAELRKVKGERNPKVINRFFKSNVSKMQPKEFMALTDDDFHDNMPETAALKMIAKRDAMIMKLSSTPVDKAAYSSVRRSVNDLIPIPTGGQPNRRARLQTEARRRRALVQESVAERFANARLVNI